MDVNYDYNAAFRGISVKLRKRFLRKPNVSDAIEDYTTLSKQLESEECFGLSGYCLQQTAKCYHNVGNTVSESAALQTAAKQYLNSEIASTIESNILTFNENLLSAISLYEEAIRLHCDQNERLIAAKLCLELADILGQKFDKHFESISYYQRALTLFSTSNEKSATLPVIFVMFKLAAIKVFTSDYSGALADYTEICDSILNKCVQPSLNSSKTKSQANDSILIVEGSSQNQSYNKPIGIYSSLLVEADISKLLLLLYLKPTKMKPEHSNTIEVYSWFQTLSNPNSNYVPIDCMDRDLFILLQSFVMACQSNDLKLLSVLQTELWPLLNDVQNFLLNLISDQILNSTYTDDLLFQ